MNSERRKRQEEIEKILRETGTSQEENLAFQEEVRKTAAAIIENETSRFQKSEQAKRRKRSISPATAGVWLLVLGAVGFIFAMPSLGAVLLLCGVMAIVWATFPKRVKPSLPNRKNVRSYRKALQNSVYRLLKKIR